MMSRVLFPALSAAALVCAAIAFQAPAKQPAAKPAPARAPAQSKIPASALAFMPNVAVNDTLHMQTHIGSFKILQRGKDLPSGRLEFTFKGTVLLTGLMPGSYIETSGNVRKEYDSSDKHAKQVFFGNGKLLIVGRFRNCEWFGRDLNLTLKGFAHIRMFSEFDKNGDTGYFWFDPTMKISLQTNMVSTDIPAPYTGPIKAITREDFEKQKAAEAKKKKGS